MKREDVFYEALKARDHRFDGKFFVGVKTTGIYCRPICPAKPKRENVEFFSNHLDAERAGYRPCLRCRPESAPRSPAWIGTSAVVRRAVRVLHDQSTLRFDEDRFASLFGVTARHLRRLFMAEIGKTPKQLFFENRLNLARKLVVETRLPIVEIAFGSGFNSVRRFNDAFKARFKKSPREIRRTPLAAETGWVISLPYRPPFDFVGLMRSYESHRVGRLERFEAGKMHRVIELAGKVGQIAISDDAAHSRLLLEIDFPDSTMIHAIVTRIRNLFDLDSDPVIIANALDADAKVGSLLRKFPGIRLPSGWEPFEVAVSAILGQAVSIERGRSLVADLIEQEGRDSGVVVDGQSVKLFPPPEKIASSSLNRLKTTAARKKALIAFSKAIASKKLSLEPTQDVDRFLEMMMALPGVGPWTATYVALKALRHTDAFPATDLILARALDRHSRREIERMRPWRGYVAALFWRHFGESLSKKRGR